LHAAVWPEVLDALRKANVTNYSIFRRDSLLFSYMEYRGSDLVADMAGMASDPATKRWWEVVMPLQRTMRSSADEEWWARWKKCSTSSNRGVMGVFSQSARTRYGVAR